MKKVRLLLISIIGVAIMQSCIKSSDFDFNKMASPVYTGEWALPLTTSHITLRDLLKNQDSILQTDQQGLVSLVYTIKNLTSQTADQLMKIPNQSLPVNTFSFPTTIPNTNIPIINLSSGQQFSISFTSDLPLTLANATQKLDSIYIKTGTITIPINSNFNKTTVFTIQAPNIIKKATRVKLVIPPIDISQATPNSSVSIDISDCILILKTVDGVANTLHFDIGMTMQGNDQAMPPNYTFGMGVRITNVQFASLYGNLGSFTMNLSQTVDLSVFKTNLAGGFQFGPDAVKLNINVDNSFGLPIQLNANTLTAHSDINTPHNVPIKLFTPPTENIINIAAPTVFGQTRTTTVASTNPNISDAFNILPNKIFLQATALTNPGSTGNLNFVSDKSTINVNMDIMLKLFASITNYSLQDTLSFDLKNADQLESAAFRINTTNGFPLGVRIQVIFTDEKYNLLETMFTEPSPEMLKPAIASGSPDYKTITPTKYQFPDILYDHARLLKIKNAKKIIIKAVLSTTNNGLVKIYDSYYIDTQISLRTKAKYQL